MLTKSERRIRKELRERSIREIAAAKAATEVIVASNRCPTCGGPLRHNNALHGWWQCAQFGSEAFRADPLKPSCDWQGFTN